MSESTSSQRTPLFRGKRFDGIIPVMLALVTVLITVTGFLQQRVDAKFENAAREARQFTTQSLGGEATGQIEAGYAWSDAYRRWAGLDTLASRAEADGDEPAARRYRAARDRVAKLSPLLDSPYFDPNVDDAPKIRRFQSDLFVVESARLTEQSDAKMALAGKWFDKSNQYTTQIILLAVSLFVLGVSATITGRVRRLLVGGGSILVVISFGWMLATALGSVPERPQDAIEAYADGVGLSSQDEFEGAISEFDKALEMVPDYANAYYERGLAYYNLDNFGSAASDFELARDAGRNDVGVPWNLGWTYYLLGSFEDSTRTTQVAIEKEPTQVVLYLNLGIAHLAAGDLELAGDAYRKGLDMATSAVAAGQEVPESLWWNLDASGIDLNTFLNCVNNRKGCGTNAPPFDAIATSSAVIAEAEDWSKELKDLSVGLEYTGKLPPGGPPAATVSPFRFLSTASDEPGEEFPAGTAIVFVDFDYKGMQDGQRVIVKVILNWEDRPGQRLDAQWSLGQEGKAGLPLSPGGLLPFQPGEYWIEMYVNSQLVQSGGFTIAEA